MAGAVAIQIKPEKIWYFEWLRVAACLAVVLIHCFATVLDNYSVEEVGIPRALGWTETLVFLGRWAVPVFLMITGALLLNPQKQISYQKAFNYAKRIAFILVTFGFVYALMELVFSAKSFSLAMLPAAILNVFEGKSWAHLWYLYDLLGIYLLLPVVKAFIDKSDKRMQGIFLVVLFVCTSLAPTINGALGWEIENLVWFSSSFFYFVLGHYLNTYVELTPKIAATSVGAVAIAALATGGVSRC